MKIYIASSWKNEQQVIFWADVLRNAGHEVDAFCDASTGRFVFSFDQLPDVSNMNAITVLNEDAVQRAFLEDKKWIDWADAVLLILPSGKSAHLEAGYAKGSGKKLVIFNTEFPKGDFDVMYGFADLVTDEADAVRDYFKLMDGVVRERFLEGERKCRVCGCTEFDACDGGCWWVEPDLCSACTSEPDGESNA